MDKQYIPSIGKDVIESLTVGMYEDSRFIFREYIQNSADQIDKAIKEGLIKKPQGEIHIQIDADKRTILIEDNATGIPQDQVQPILQNIAASTKIRGIDKGFRGIGRLGGLAYCEKLIFETSYKGEASKTVLTWDAALLRNLINNRNQKEEAVDVIQKVTHVQQLPEKSDEHYFKVLLQGVTVEELLNKEEIGTYLSMVAPLPFATSFIYKKQIADELKKEGISLDEYNIYLNTEQLFKGYSTYIYDGDHQNKKKADEIIDIIFFKELDENKNLLYWGWYGVSGFNRQLKSINHARGFRLRKSNIQIGSEYALQKLHRDKRFNFYFFGEIHGMSNDLIPNSRRDYFIENAAYNSFEKKLRNYFHTHIHKLCFTAADINTAVRKMEDLMTFQEEFKEKQRKGFNDKQEHAEYVEKFEAKKEEALKAKRKIERIEQDAQNDNGEPIKKILNRVTQPEVSAGIEKLKMPKSSNLRLRTDKMNLSNKEKTLLTRVFGLIREVIEADTAEHLIQRIEEELK